MNRRLMLWSAVAGVSLAGCGGSTPRRDSAHAAARLPSARLVARHQPRLARRRDKPAGLVALVTAQSANRVLMIALPSGRVLASAPVTGDPGYVASSGPGGPFVVVSAAGRVTLLGGPRLRRQAVLGGFGSPHIPAVAPGDGWAYVTDDARGQIATIGLNDERVETRTFVGAGAHHLAVSPDGRRIWVALGQAASTIVILSTVTSHPHPSPAASPIIDPRRPRIVGRWHPGFLVHDLLFSSDGRQVWVTAANRSDVSVYRARDRRLVFRVPAGTPPQHVVFAGDSAYITSGYAGRIERVSIVSGRIITRTAAPFGSFDLDAAGPYVATSSLFEGTLAIYNHALKRLRVRRVATSAEDVALTTP